MLRGYSIGRWAWWLDDRLPGVCSIDSDFIGFGGILAEVFDMTENMSTAVLACEVTQMCTQSHVCGRGLPQAPFLDRKTFEQPEALAVNQNLAQLLHARF